jgi:NAD(P)-dependent dehydrogenase (short-subunit alcohol dehydrogenase family)
MSENIFICSISSDIGAELAERYQARGDHVIGTYRDARNVGRWNGNSAIDLIPCDVSRPADIQAAAAVLGDLRRPWSTFIGAVGQLSPIGPFFDCDIDEWCRSLMVNSLDQLRVLHAIYPQRGRDRACRVVFLVGGGINNAFTNYSAYCLGKLMLIKMCELLDDEYPDLHAVAIGTGWVNTKIHRQTLEAEVHAGMNYRRTYEFVTSGKPGTSYSDIFDCINWCFAKDRALTGGRNFSVVHDPWKTHDARLLFDLSQDLNKFKLRRSGG